jgi:hypothetical protein
LAPAGDAVLDALRHTVGRDQHMPVLLELVQHQIGPITYAEIEEEWDDLIAALWRAARSHMRQLPKLDPRST